MLATRTRALSTTGILYMTWRRSCSGGGALMSQRALKVVLQLADAPSSAALTYDDVMRWPEKTRRALLTQEGDYAPLTRIERPDFGTSVH